MVNHCAVGGCNNRAKRDTSSRRNFLLFHIVPKDLLRRAAWDKRINRADEDLKRLQTYRVCSDHFNDSDYQPYDWQHYVRTGEAKRMKLNSTCVPNTDPESGAISLYLPGQPSVKRPRRTVTRNHQTEHPLSDDPCNLQSDIVTVTETSSQNFSEEECVGNYWEYLEENITSRVAQTQTSESDFIDPTEPTKPETENISHRDQIDTDELLLEEIGDCDNKNDPDFPEPGRKVARTSLFSFGPQLQTDYRRRITEFVWTVVSIQNLLSLFKWCPLCGSSAESLPGSCVIGYVAFIHYRCYGPGAHTGVWKSSESSDRNMHLNILINTASSLCGIGHTALNSLFETMKMPTMSGNSYHEHEKTWLFPAVYSMFIDMRNRAVESIRGKERLILTGDGQFDSPGHTAKYCVYTVMDHDSGRIIDFLIAQRGVVKEELERAACRELLKKLIGKGIDAFSFVTDRHSGIKAMIRDATDFKNIEHYFDIWHLAKSISKTLGKMTKLKRNASLLPWVKKLLNHFWYCCRNCGGDKRKLIETWLSFLLHISNTHRWTTGTFSKLRGTQPHPNFTKVFTCAHGKRIRKASNRKGKWLNRSSRTFKDLFAKLTKTQLVEDIQHCSSFLHTGSLENYHSVRLKYLPKRIGFTRATTAIKSMIAIIEVNSNIQCSDAKERKLYAAYSKAQAGWVLKKVHETKDYTYRSRIMASIQNSVSANEPIEIDMTEYIPQEMPKNMAPVPKPSKESMLEKHRSRMALG